MGNICLIKCHFLCYIARQSTPAPVFLSLWTPLVEATIKWLPCEMEPHTQAHRGSTIAREKRHDFEKKYTGKEKRENKTNPVVAATAETFFKKSDL